ncbi:MAG: HDIG domain-containing protein [Spirochaetia bacterium]|nr:HDIG domain-containing protein [Spirochaetia bacterium]
MITREEAFSIYTTYNSSPTLLKHALSVEATMKRFALYYKEDVEYWGIVGLLHDIDYEKYPQEHCKMAPVILRKHNIEEEMIHSIVSHGWGLCSDVEPVSTMEKVLYTIDELTGLISATALMRPSKSLSDLEVKSVMKKWKTKGFSAGVDRDLILGGCKMLNLELSEVISLTIEGMRSIAKELDFAS